MSKQKVTKPRSWLLLVLAIFLVISIGLNVFQFFFSFETYRTIDKVAVLVLSFFGICLGIIFFWLRSGIDVEENNFTNLKTQILSSIKSIGKDALDTVLKDYEITNKEVERRENINLVVGTIIITGSLLILGNTASVVSNTASTYSVLIFPYALSSILFFTLWLFFLHYTTAKLDSLVYPRMRAIEEVLTDHFGFSFGVHSFTKLAMLQKGKNMNYPWVEVRRRFWGIIMIALSVSWLSISLFRP